MAHIKITGQMNMLEISNDRAKEIKRLILDETVPNNQPIDLGSMLITKSSVKAVFLDTELKDDFRNYDLNNPEHKQIVRDFESELGDRSFNQYCLDKGFYTGEPPREVMALSKLKEYEEAKKKFNGLKDLRILRKTAQGYEAEANKANEIDVAKIAETMF